MRAAWRARLAHAHGSWLCATCKCAYASQAQFVEMTGVVELIRHSECGHVIMWRDGGTGWVAPYLPEPIKVEFRPDVVERLRGGKYGTRWSRKHDACVECGLTDKPHHSNGVCERCNGKVRYWKRKRS